MDIKCIVFNFVLICSFEYALGMEQIELHCDYGPQSQVSMGTQAFVKKTMDQTKMPFYSGQAASGMPEHIDNNGVRWYEFFLKPKIASAFDGLQEGEAASYLRHYIEVLRRNDSSKSGDKLFDQAKQLIENSIRLLPEPPSQKVARIRNLCGCLEKQLRNFIFQPTSQPQPQAPHIPQPAKSVLPTPSIQVQPCKSAGPKVSEFEGKLIQSLDGANWRHRTSLQCEQEEANLIVSKDLAFKDYFTRKMKDLGISDQTLTGHSFGNVAVSLADNRKILCTDKITVEDEHEIKEYSVGLVLKEGSRELPIDGYEGFFINVDTKTKPGARPIPLKEPFSKKTQIKPKDENISAAGSQQLALPVEQKTDGSSTDEPSVKLTLAQQRFEHGAQRHAHAKSITPNANVKPDKKAGVAPADTQQQTSIPKCKVNESTGGSEPSVNAATATEQKELSGEFVKEKDRPGNSPLESTPSPQIEEKINFGAPGVSAPVPCVQEIQQPEIEDDKPKHVEQVSSEKTPEVPVTERLKQHGKAILLGGIKEGVASAAEFTARTLVDRAWNAWDHSSYSTPPRITKYNSFLPQPFVSPSQMSPSSSIVWDVPATPRFVPAACGMEGPRATIQDGQGPSPEQIKAFIAKTNAVYSELRQCFEQDPVLKNTNRIVDSFNEMALIFADFGNTKVAAALANIARSTLSNGRVFLRAAGNGLANTGYELAQDLRRPDIYLARNAVGIFDSAVCLMSEIERIEQLDQAMFSGDSRRFDAEAERYTERCQAQAARVNAMLQELRSMPWEAFVEHGFAAGSRIFADIFALNAISLGASAFKTIAPQIDAFIEAASAEKAVAAAAGIKAPGMKTMETFAVAGKVAADGGIDVAEQVSEVMRANPGAMQEGKAFGLVAQETVKDCVWTMPEKGKSINGRWYTRHALERMAPDTIQVRAILENRALKEGRIQGTKAFNDYVQPRGIPPTVVEDAIQNGMQTLGEKPGTLVFEGESIHVVVGVSTGNVITVIPK